MTFYWQHLKRHFQQSILKVDKCKKHFHFCIIKHCIFNWSLSIQFKDISNLFGDSNLQISTCPSLKTPESLYQYFIPLRFDWLNAHKYQLRSNRHRTYKVKGLNPRGTQSSINSLDSLTFTKPFYMLVYALKLVGKRIGIGVAERSKASKQFNIQTKKNWTGAGSNLGRQKKPWFLVIHRLARD